MFENLFDLGILLRLVLATIGGLILGLPYRNRPGGLRAHLLVTLGAAYFCTTAREIVGAGSPEVIRVIQGVTSGIGFVGAATVFKKGGSTHGVSTAASIWIAAAVGCEAGLGTGLTILVIAPVIAGLSVIVGWVERRSLRKRRGAILTRRLRREDHACPPH
jgi:putative Mg2+ transporter-C (MgtC) family protein